MTDPAPLEIHVTNLRAAAASAHATAEAASKMALALALAAHDMPVDPRVTGGTWRRSAQGSRLAAKLRVFANRLDGELGDAEEELMHVKKGGIG